MEHTITITKYYSFKNSQEREAIISILDKKVSDLLSSISQLKIVPSKIEVMLRPFIYTVYPNMQKGHSQMEFEDSYVAVVDVNMDYYYGNTPQNEIQEEQKTLETFSEHMNISWVKSKHNLFDISRTLNYHPHEITVVAHSHEEMHKQLRERFFSLIPEIKLENTPNITFKLILHKIMKDKSGRYLIKGKIQEEYFASKQKVKTNEDDGDDPR